MLDRAAAVLDRLDRRLQVLPSVGSTPDSEKTPVAGQVGVRWLIREVGMN